MTHCPARFVENPREVMNFDVLGRNLGGPNLGAAPAEMVSEDEERQALSSVIVSNIEASKQPLYFVNHRGVIVMTSEFFVVDNTYVMYGHVWKLYCLKNEVKRIEVIFSRSDLTKALHVFKSSIIRITSSEEAAVIFANTLSMVCKVCRRCLRVSEFSIEGFSRKVRCEECRQERYKKTRYTGRKEKLVKYMIKCSLAPLSIASGPYDEFDNSGKQQYLSNDERFNSQRSSVTSTPIDPETAQHPLDISNDSPYQQAYANSFDRDSAQETLFNLVSIVNSLCGCVQRMQSCIESCNCSKKGLDMEQVNGLLAAAKTASQALPSNVSEVLSVTTGIIDKDITQLNKIYSPNSMKRNNQEISCSLEVQTGSSKRNTFVSTVKCKNSSIKNFPNATDEEVLSNFYGGQSQHSSAFDGGMNDSTKINAAGVCSTEFTSRSSSAILPKANSTGGTGEAMKRTGSDVIIMNDEADFHVPESIDFAKRRRLEQLLNHQRLHQTAYSSRHGQIYSNVVNDKFFPEGIDERHPYNLSVESLKNAAHKNDNRHQNQARKESRSHTFLQHYNNECTLENKQVNYTEEIDSTPTLDDLLFEALDTGQE